MLLESIIRVNILWMFFFTFKAHLQSASQALRGQHLQHEHIYPQKEWSRKDMAAIKLVTRKSHAFDSRHSLCSILSFFPWILENGEGKGRWAKGRGDWEKGNPRGLSGWRCWLVFSMKNAQYLLNDFQRPMAFFQTFWTHVVLSGDTYGWASQPQHSWHFEPDYCCGGCPVHCRMLAPSLASTH